MSELEIAVLKIMCNNDSLSYQTLDRKIIFLIGLEDSSQNPTVGKNLQLAVEKLTDKEMLILTGENNLRINCTQKGKEFIENLKN